MGSRARSKLLRSQLAVALMTLAKLDISSANPASTATSTAPAQTIRTDGSELGITIIGSIVQKNDDDNVALIKQSSGAVSAIKKGQYIGDLYHVVAVTGGFIEVTTRDAKLYRIYQDKFAMASDIKTAPTPSSTGPALVAIGDQFREDGFERNKDKVTMTGMYRDKLIKEDLAKVLMQATAEPFFENGQIVGFRMSQIDESSIYQKSGLVNGDIVMAINGQELNNVARSISLLHTLKSADRIEVEVRRDGAPIKITVEVR